MSDAQTLPVLQQVVQRESRSLLQYIGDAFPWTTAGERDAWTHLQRLIEDQRRGVGVLVQMLVRRKRNVPYLGSYPSQFTTLNFVALDHVVALLVDHQRQSIASLERDLAHMGDAEAREQLQSYLEMKRRHLQRLGNLATPDPEPALH